MKNLNTILLSYIGKSFEASKAEIEKVYLQDHPKAQNKTCWMHCLGNYGSKAPKEHFDIYMLATPLQLFPAITVNADDDIINYIDADFKR